MGELGGSGPAGGRTQREPFRRLQGLQALLWPLAWLGLAGLFAVQVWRGPRTLEALRPWGPAFEGLPLERCSGSVPPEAVDDLELEDQERFVDEVQLALLGLAERLNELRQVGTEALRRGDAAELSQAGERARSALERELCRQALGRPLFLSGRDFLLRGAQGGLWRLDLGGFDACLRRLPQLDLGSRASIEALLGDLDRAYYRLVAVYRALAELEPGSVGPDPRRLAAHP